MALGKFTPERPDKANGVEEKELESQKQKPAESNENG